MWALAIANVTFGSTSDSSGYLRGTPFDVDKDLGECLPCSEITLTNQQTQGLLKLYLASLYNDITTLFIQKNNNLCNLRTQNWSPLSLLC